LVNQLGQDIIPTNIVIKLDNDPINMSSKGQASFGQFWINQGPLFLSTSGNVARFETLLPSLMFKVNFGNFG